MPRFLPLLSACLLCACPGPETPGETGSDAGTEADAGTAAGSDAGDPCSRSGVQRIVSLAMEPEALVVEKGGQARLAVWATFENGCVRNVSGSVSYLVADPAIVEVVETAADEDALLPGRAVLGLKKGETTVLASTGLGGQGVAAPRPVAVRVNDAAAGGQETETRAVWVTRFAFRSDKAGGTADIQRIVNKAADSGFNAVFFQVRGAGEAYYESSLVPWWLTATDASGKKQLGKNPGWDPLQVALTAARARGVQLHAYVNAMSGWAKASGEVPEPFPGAPAHVLRNHPEWRCLDAAGADSAAEYTYIAADEGYRRHFADVVEEILARYDVDGIHLDRIRTPGSGFCHSPGLDAAYRARYGTDQSRFGEFQREQIDLMVKAVYDRVIAKKPRVAVSAAVWGIYKRLPGCTTSQGFADYHQDSLGWAQKGFIDMLNPMIYWDLAPGSCTDWGALVDGFASAVAGRQIVAGMHAREKDGKAHIERISARIEHGRKRKLPGQIVFASAYLDSDGTWDLYKAGPYLKPLPPTPITHRPTR